MNWVRPFGNTGLQVSALGFGTGQVGGEADPGDILNVALDMGITLIDTARGYGLAEERIGKQIAHRRSEYVLSTKIGYGVEGYDDWTPEIITAGIERALKLMKTDVIDIVHFHSCPQEILDKSGIMEPLEEARKKGKIRVAAYSGENEVFGWAVDSGQFGSVQTSVNICDQLSLNQWMPLAAKRGMGVIGKRAAANAPWRFTERPIGDYAEEYWVRWKQMGIDPKGFDWDELFLRFSAHARGVSSCIVGTRNIEHLERDIELVKRGPLPTNVADSIHQAFLANGHDWAGQV